MKNKILLIVLLLLSTKIITAQTLTIKQVYDFEIGDEFYFSVPNPYGPYSYNKKIVLDKYINYQEDTMMYVVEKLNYSPIVEGNQVVSYNIYTTSIDTFGYSNLDSSIVLSLCSLCLFDTILDYYEEALCNKFVNEIRDYNGYFYYMYKYGEGLGQTNYFSEEYAGPPSLKWDMIGYVKEGVVCGQTHDDIVGVEYLKNENNRIKIFPNPNVEKSLNIDLFEDDFGMLVISNLQGKKILEETLRNKVSQVDLTKFSNGFYLIMIITNKAVYSEKLILK